MHPIHDLSNVGDLTFYVFVLNFIFFIRMFI